MRFSSFLAIAILARPSVDLAAAGKDALTEGDSSRTRERFADTESHFQERLVDHGADEEFLFRSDDRSPDGRERLLASAALAAPGKDAPFGTFLTKGDSSRTRERVADTESHFQERLVNQAAGEEALEALDRAPDERDKLAKFKDDSAADEDFRRAIDRAPDRAPDKGKDDLAVSRVTTEDELSDIGELRIQFNNRKLARLLAHVFETRPPSDSQIREAVNQKNGRQLYLLVRCPVCQDSMHSETLATPSCGHEIHDECLDKSGNVCPICKSKGPHGDTNVETLLKKLLELFEDEGVLPPVVLTAYDKAIKSVKTHFSFTEKTIRDIADVLQRTGGILKDTNDAFQLSALLFNHARNGLPLPRAIWGVTVFELSSSRSTPGLPATQSEQMRAAVDERFLDYESDSESDSESESESESESDNESDGLDGDFDDMPDPESESDNESDESGDDDALLAVLLATVAYTDPETLFRQANGDLAAGDAELKPADGAVHACAHFLRELSIVRQLAMMTFHNIEIAEIPSFESCQWGSATFSIDISESVVNWVRSLADTVHTEAKPRSFFDKAKLIEKVQNANMMMQALLLYTIEGSGMQTQAINVTSTAVSELRKFRLSDST